MVERRFPKPDVEGSSPSGRVFRCILRNVGQIHDQLDKVV